MQFKLYKKRISLNASQALSQRKVNVALGLLSFKDLVIVSQRCFCILF